MANEKRLIDANALWHKTFTCEDAADVRKEIENAPTVDAVEVVHGRWVFEQAYEDGTADYKCSVCDFDDAFPISNFTYRNYCPNCGSQMDGGDGE